MRNQVNRFGQDNRLTKPYLVFLLASLACLLWATAFPFIKLSYHGLGIRPEDTYQNLLFAAYRFFTAGLFLIGYLLIRRQPILPSQPKYFREILLLGLVQTSLQYYFFYIGLAHTTGIKSSIIGAVAIYLTVITAHFYYQNDRINWQKVLGLIIGFSGVIVVNQTKGEFSFDFTWQGEGFLIISAVFSTIASILAKNTSRKVSAVLATAYQMIIGSLVLFGLAITKVSPFALHFQFLTLMLFLWLAALSAIAFSIWYFLLNFNPLGKVAIYQFEIPVFGALFSALLIPGESFNLTMLFAMALVALGIIIVHYQPGEIQLGIGEG